MPIYEYKCESCEHELEERQSFNNEPLINCPACKQDKLYRVISGGIKINGCRTNHQDVKTIQHYAERNAEKMGRYELEEKRAEHASRLPQNRPGRRPVGKGRKPWWRESEKVDTSLAKLTPQQKAKYIETGTKP